MDASSLQSVPVPIPAGSASKTLLGRHCWVLAVSLAESTGSAAASVDLVDGGASSGAVLIPVRLATSGLVLTTYGDGAVEFKNGISLVVNSGSVVGSVVIGEQL